MDDATIGSLRMHSTLQTNPASKSDKASSRELPKPLDQNIKEVSKEVFDKASFQNQEGPDKLQNHHEIKEIKIEDEDDEDLKALKEMEERELQLQNKEELTLKEESSIQNQVSKELDQAHTKDTQKQEVLHKAETHQHKATTHRTIEHNEMAGARRLQLNVEALKSLTKNAYIYRKDGGFENSLAYARLTNAISQDLKNPSVINELLRHKTPSKEKSQEGVKEQASAQRNLSNQQVQSRELNPPREKLENQNLLIVKNNTIYVPENLQHEFTPGKEIELPKENGEMEKVVINHVVILNQEEYAEFRQNMSVAIEQTIHAAPQVMHQVDENKKRGRSENQDPLEERPIRQAKTDINDERSVKPNEIKRPSNTPIAEETFSPSEKRKQDIEKLEKILNEKYKKIMDSNKKEDISKEDSGFFVEEENIKDQLLTQAEAKIEVVNQEILQTCIILQSQEDISPQEREKYRKIEIRIKEVSSKLTQNIGSKENAVSEKVKALEEYFEEVSTNVLEFSHSSLNTTKVAPKSS